MIRIVVLLILMGGSIFSKAQIDSLLIAAQVDSLAPTEKSNPLSIASKIVLLKNNDNILPLKHLDSLTIHYINNSLLEKLGSRYTENNSSGELLINSVFGNELVEEGTGILVLYGDSIELEANVLKGFDAIIYSSHKDSVQSDLISQMIFGGRVFSDTLYSDKYGFSSGTGISTNGGKRFSFGQPRDAGLDSAYLFAKIDSIAIHAIDSGVAPGTGFGG